MQNTGRWSQDEHKKFLEGLELYGKNWKQVEEHIGSRNAAQARSHAQKYFGKYYERFNRNLVSFKELKSLAAFQSQLQKYDLQNYQDQCDPFTLDEGSSSESKSHNTQEYSLLSVRKAPENRQNFQKDNKNESIEYNSQVNKPIPFHQVKGMNRYECQAQHPYSFRGLLNTQKFQHIPKQRIVKKNLEQDMEYKLNKRLFDKFSSYGQGGNPNEKITFKVERDEDAFLKMQGQQKRQKTGHPHQNYNVKTQIVATNQQQPYNLQKNSNFQCAEQIQMPEYTWINQSPIAILTTSFMTPTKFKTNIDNQSDKYDVLSTALGSSTQSKLSSARSILDEQVLNDFQDHAFKLLKTPTPEQQRMGYQQILNMYSRQKDFLNTNSNSYERNSSNLNRGSDGFMTSLGSPQLFQNQILEQNYTNIRRNQREGSSLDNKAPQYSMCNTPSPQQYSQNSMTSQNQLIQGKGNQVLQKFETDITRKQNEMSKQKVIFDDKTIQQSRGFNNTRNLVPQKQMQQQQVVQPSSITIRKPIKIIEYNNTKSPTSEQINLLSQRNSERTIPSVQNRFLTFSPDTQNQILTQVKQTIPEQLESETSDLDENSFNNQITPSKATAGSIIQESHTKQQDENPQNFNSMENHYSSVSQDLNIDGWPSC